MHVLLLLLLFLLITVLDRDTKFCVICPVFPREGEGVFVVVVVVFHYVLFEAVSYTHLTLPTRRTV